jgi:hypothetical protein
MSDGASIPVRDCHRRQLVEEIGGMSGDPKLRQLEPHGQLAAPIGGHPRCGLTSRTPDRYRVSWTAPRSVQAVLDWFRCPALENISDTVIGA